MVVPPQKEHAIKEIKKCMKNAFSFFFESYGFTSRVGTDLIASVLVDFFFDRISPPLFRYENSVITYKK